MALVKGNKHFEYVSKTWDFKILLCIGSYGSGKSHEMFTKVAIKAAMEKRKILVVRKEYNTLKESCFADLEDAIERIGQTRRFKTTVSPLHIQNKSNKSRVIFRGLDKVRKIKSIKDIDLIVVEEADEISIEELKELIKRLRTNRVSTHMILMCNPVSRRSSIYKYFFKDLGFDEEELYEKKLLAKETIIRDELTGEEELYRILIHHSTYKDNKFLPLSFRHELESEKDPRLRRIGTEGKFGADGELVLYNAVFESNVYERYVKGKISSNMKFVGLDWGFVTSYNALIRCAINEKENELYLYWEYYRKDRTNSQIQHDIEEFKKTRERIRADNAEPKTIREFKNAGFNIVGADKGPGSVKEGIRKLRSFKRIVIDKENCKNTKSEAEDLCFEKDMDGEIIEDQFTIDPHAWDAVRYAIENYKVKSTKAKIHDLKDYYA